MHTKNNLTRLENKKEEGRSKWSDISRDILESILRRLRLTDYLRAGLVCSYWQTTVAEAIADKRCTPSPDLPCLVFESDGGPDGNLFSFFSLSKKRVFYSIRTPLEKYQTLHNTVQGWMIMSEVLCFPKFGRRFRPAGLITIFFLNPVTGTRVNLPCKLDTGHMPIDKIMASSKPTDPQCLVVCLFGSSCSFARVSEEHSWTLVEGDVTTEIYYTGVEIIDGKLYVLAGQRLDSIVMIYDLQQQEQPINGKILAKLPATPPLVHRVATNYDVTKGEIHRSLAVDASSGELYLTYLFYDSIREFLSHGYYHTNPPRVTTCQVFRLEMSPPKPKWVKVVKSDNRKFFFGDYRSLVVSTTATYGHEELNTENCIYYTLPYFDRWWREDHILLERLCMTGGCKKYFNCEGFVQDVVTSMWFIPDLD